MAANQTQDGLKQQPEMDPQQLREKHYNATILDRIDNHENLARFLIRPDAGVPHLGREHLRRVQVAQGEVSRHKQPADQGYNKDGSVLI